MNRVIFIGRKPKQTTTMPRQYPPRQPPRSSRKELTRDQRNHNLGAAAAGEKSIAIACRLELSKSTIYNTVKKGPDCNERGQQSQPRSRPRKTTKENDDFLIEAAMIGLIRPLRELNINIMPSVYQCTLQQRLHEKNVKKHCQREKLLLTGAHRQKRFNWALEHENWTYDDWAKVIWSDECLIELGSGHRKPWVFYRVGQDFQETDAVETRKRIRVMIWAASCGKTKSEAIVLKRDLESARGGVIAT